MATATTEIYTLSLHDALPIYAHAEVAAERLEPMLHRLLGQEERAVLLLSEEDVRLRRQRSEEHTSELQSREKLVCRLLLEKKKQTKGNKEPASSCRHFLGVVT